MGCDPPGDLGLAEEDVHSPLSNFHPARVSFFFRKNSTRANLSLGRWPAAITWFFSCRTAFSVPSLTFRRAGLPRCASERKSDCHQLPCGGPLPEHGTTILNYFASKQTTGYAAVGSPRRITLCCTYQYYVPGTCQGIVSQCGTYDTYCNIKPYTRVSYHNAIRMIRTAE